MEKDLRRGRGSWRGCHSFEDISFEGPSCVMSRKRDGGLKMGGRYWYYYVLDGDVEFHSPAEPSTTGCPFLPGQAVNVLELPFELGPEQTHDRSHSASDISWPMTSARTLDPTDKYMKPRPAPTPGRLHLGSAPSSLSRWMSLPYPVMANAPSWSFKRASSSLKRNSSFKSRKDSTDTLSRSRRPGNSRREEVQIRHSVPLAQANNSATWRGTKKMKGPMTHSDSLETNHTQQRLSSATTIKSRHRPSPLGLNHPQASGPVQEPNPAPSGNVASSKKRPTSLLTSKYPSYYSERSVMGPVSRFSMYSTPTTARSRNSGYMIEKSTTISDLIEHQLRTSPASELSPTALSPTFSDGNGSYSTTELSSPCSQQHESLYNSLSALPIRDDWFDDTQGYSYPYHLPEGDESEATIRKITTTPNPSSMPSMSHFAAIEQGWGSENNEDVSNSNDRKYSNVNAMRSIFDELGYLGNVIARN
ncbi:MAG: hypothetical protein M1816_002791 [Peltula sp. TS41687]|nr:MAG: hypothetical protein M1816_002791 [Peltula sp. TS41687]